MKRIAMFRYSTFDSDLVAGSVEKVLKSVEVIRESCFGLGR
jgi:hypothetical protein